MIIDITTRSATELSPLHKFLIRNIGLISREDMAKFLEVPVETVDGWMASLGLPKMETLDRERAFPVIARVNHDLLSEEDIARLLGMPKDEYHKATLEMDFLDIKLGAKPSDLPNIEAAPNFESVARMFRTATGSYFADSEQWEKRFSFLEQFKDVEPPLMSSLFTSDRLPLRMMYSYTGTHGDFLLTGEDFYSEGTLSRLRNRGVNAGWMPALLRDMAPSRHFPEFGKGHEVRIENLRRQVAQAAKYGIKVFLYFNEPRFLPGQFFERHPEARGMPSSQPGYYGMCTSDASVRDWLREATEFLFQQVPDLGGVVLITASEYRTNCYSHRVEPDNENHDGLGLTDSGTEMCPRCAEREIGQVLSDTANTMSEGIKSSGSDAQVVQWLWGWDLVMPKENVREAIQHLPQDATVMVDWAKYTSYKVFGKTAEIGEYTLAYVEPSEFAQGIIATARQQGKKVLSRCALVSTVEMNALPYLPVMKNVERLLAELEKHEMDGLLGSWIFGAYPGRNMELLTYLDEDQPLLSLAHKYYGKGAQEAMEAWRLFSEGMKYYPTTVSVLYLSALNPGPGLRFPLEPEPWRQGMVAMATEQIEEISQPFGADVMIKGFRAVAEHFERGLSHLRAAVGQSDRDEWREENLRDLGISEACMRHLISAANYSEFIITRERWLADQEDDTLRERLVEILRNEIENTETMLKLAKKDSRIGYEGSIGYFYTPVEMIQKIYEMRDLTSSLSPAVL